MSTTVNNNEASSSSISASNSAESFDLRMKSMEDQINNLSLAFTRFIKSRVLILPSSNLTLLVPLWLLCCCPITFRSTLSRRWFPSGYCGGWLNSNLYPRSAQFFDCRRLSNELGALASDGRLPHSRPSASRRRPFAYIRPVAGGDSPVPI
ncbi:hypothetical protein ACTFIT_009756 [Dictyostelium discoideum]